MQLRASLPAPVRRDLLWLLLRPDPARAEAIRQFFEHPNGRELAETLIDLESDELMQQRVIDALDRSLADDA